MFTLDFSCLSRGTYVTDQLESVYGVEIIGYKWDRGYVPNNAARVFDTSNPGGRHGNDKLGSPNEDFGGPGEGHGGEPGSPYANSVAQGNALIIQRSSSGTPRDTEEGGTILFRFEKPVYLEYVTMLDGGDWDDSSDSSDDGNGEGFILMSLLWDGTVSEHVTAVYGANGVNTEHLNLDYVRELWVKMPGNGAVSEIKYRMCR